jgi:hypothetical protein
MKRPARKLFVVIPGRPAGPDPESITPVCDYGFRVRSHSASKTRVNALLARAPE